MNRYEEIDRHGKLAIGKKELLRYLSGEKITLAQMIKAKCYECMGTYADGKNDCEMKDCPLYARMPYREGGVAPVKIMSKETKKKLGDRMKNIRASKIDSSDVASSKKVATTKKDKK